MFDDLNRVTITGSLGADPEIRSFQNGGRVATFRVASSESWKDRQTGERKQHTEWITVSVFSDGLIGLVERFLRKGTKVYVEGKFKTRKWQDRNGQDRYSTEVVIQGFGGTVKKMSKDDQGGGGRSDRDDQRNDGDGWGSGGGSGGSSGGDRKWGGGHVSDSGGGGGGFNDDLDDDIPF